MTPAIQDFPVYRGAKWEYTLNLKDGAGDPLDLTGLGPFVFSVKPASSDDLLFNATITSDYDATGVVVLTLEASKTILLSAGSSVRHGLRDALDNPYLVGFLNVEYFAPAPAA